MDAPKKPPPAHPLAGRLTAEAFEQARAKALLFAKRRTHSNTKAEELVDEAIAASFDPDESPWDPDTEPDFARHLVTFINNRAPAERRKEARRNDEGWQTKAADATTQPAPTPEERFEGAERQADAAGALDDAIARLRGAGHERPARVLELWRDEIDEAAEQARILGCSVNDIHRAREVVRRYLRKAKTSSR